MTSLGTLAALIGAALVATSPAVSRAHTEGGAAHADGRPAVSSPAPSGALAVSAGTTTTNPWPALSARYRVSIKRPGKPASSQTWTLHRSAEQIALIKGPIEDLWWRDGRGAVGLNRVLRDDRAVIEYAPGELKTLDLAMDWDALATLFDDAQLPALKARGEQRRQGRVLARYTGTLGGEKVDLQWDPALRLPSKLVRESREGRVQYELLEQHAQAPAAWPVAGHGTEAFERIDASDFGDMPYNPAVRKAETLDVRAGWRATHGH